MTEMHQKEIADRVAVVLTRYSEQNALRGVEPAAIAAVAARLAMIAARREKPAAQAEGAGEPPEMSAEEVTALVMESLAGLAAAAQLAAPVKQLVKGCFQATRRACRESYREVDRSGVCRRQVLARARERVSGTHCVDCPYWTQLTAETHEALLAGAWAGAGGAAELAAERAVFLPEDFRALRRTMWNESPAGETTTGGQ